MSPLQKCNNFTYLQQIFFIYVLNCCWINEIYVKKKNNRKIYYVTAHYDVIYYILIYHRRKFLFKEIVDSYKVINE